MNVKKYRSSEVDYEDEYRGRRQYKDERRIDKHPKSIYNMLSSEDDFEDDDEQDLDDRH